MKDKSDRPTILVNGADIELIVSEAESYLIEAFDHLDRQGRMLFQRDGSIVGIGRYPFHNELPRLLFVEKVKENLIELLSTIITWKQITIDKDGKEREKIVACPSHIATTYLARRGLWHLPVITGIITAPTMREDGSILDRVGYDKATGLYLDTQGVKFPDIPQWPTREDARMCLEFILSMVSEVPFVVDEDHGHVSRSVFLSAVLSALVRPILPAVPFYGIDAPTPGTGKSILVDAISYLVDGIAAAMLAQGDEAETEKVLSAALQAGMRIICFDNCTDPIGGALLCQAVTQPRLKLRVLGKSELKDRTNNALYFGNANNLIFTGDITRRAVKMTMDARCERPKNGDSPVNAPTSRSSTIARRSSPPV